MWRLTQEKSEFVDVAFDWLLASLPSYIPPYMPPYMPASLPACLPACIPPCSCPPPRCPPPSLPLCLLACITVNTALLVLLYTLSNTPVFVQTRVR